MPTSHCGSNAITGTPGCSMKLRITSSAGWPSVSRSTANRSSDDAVPHACFARYARMKSRHLSAPSHASSIRVTDAPFE
jgi:hypothetical protein